MEDALSAKRLRPLALPFSPYFVAFPKRQVYSPAVQFTMMTVNGKTIGIRDIMRPAVLVEETQTLKEVLARMIKEKRNSLTVVDADGRFVGAVNAIDIIKEVLPDYLEEDAIAAQFADAELLKEDAQRVQDKQVKEFMATDIPTVTVDDSLLGAAVIATGRARGRITVLDADRKPIGILTRTEIKQVIGSFLDIPDSLS